MWFRKPTFSGRFLNFYSQHPFSHNRGIIYSLIDKVILSSWFRKPTFSGRFLNFYSQHPFSHNRGIIYSLVDKVILSSHPTFHKENMNFIINILIDNGYPLKVIFSTIRKRLHSRSHCNAHKSKDHSGKSTCTYFSILYVSFIAKKLFQFFKNISFSKLVFSGYNKLNKFIKVHKDFLSTFLRSNVVYKINCSDCDASYVGQTKRTLNTRVSEHRNHIRKNTPQNSVITNHRLQFNHDFDWDNVRVLDEEINYNKRLISEMIYIKKQKKGLNAQTDTELLDPIYNDLIHSSF